MFIKIVLNTGDIQYLNVDQIVSATENGGNVDILKVDATTITVTNPIDFINEVLGGKDSSSLTEL